MRFYRILSSVCIAFVVMFVLSATVHPAMAAESFNEQFCQNCQAGSDLASMPGFEGRQVPTMNVREIGMSSGSLTRGMSTISGTQTFRSEKGKMTIQDPRRPGGNRQNADSIISGAAGTPLGQHIANLTEAGYALEWSGTHRYETTLKSDDFLVLNSTQKAWMAEGSFPLTSEDTVVTYRDVTYYSFFNSGTNTFVYLAQVQRLDSAGNPVEKPEFALSPAFTPDGLPASRATSVSMAASASLAAASASKALTHTENHGSKYCFWEWTVLVTLGIGLVLNLLIVAGLIGPTSGPIILAGVAQIFVEIYNPGGALGYGDVLINQIKNLRPLFIALSILTGIILLIFFLYALYDLGICMGWWDPFFEKPDIWTYEQAVNDADNGRTVPAILHDRFALALFTETRADPDAKWEIRSISGGIVKKDTIMFSSENGTIQSWLFDLSKPGPQLLSLTYKTGKPMPATIPSSGTYIIRFEVAPGSFDIDTVESSINLKEDSLPASLALDKSGDPHICYYDSGKKQIRYSVQKAGEWHYETVAGTAGTKSVSIAIDSSGNPACSFGDGVSYGNLRYAYRNASGWNVETVDTGGSMGNVGGHSSLIFDNHGLPRIAYINGNHFASLQFATRNTSSQEWKLETFDTNGVLGDTGYEPSVVLDAAGKPYIAYRDGKHFANLMAGFTGPSGAWQTFNVDNGGSTTGNTGFHPSIALDPIGKPHISYYDSDRQALRHASWDGNSWKLETIDVNGHVGEFSSLAITADGKMFVSYYDATNHELRYATKDPATVWWVKRTIDNEGNVGTWTTLALDTQGHPHIVYFDATHHALKYAGWKA